MARIIFEATDLNYYVSTFTVKAVQIEGNDFKPFAKIGDTWQVKDILTAVANGHEIVLIPYGKV